MKGDISRYFSKVELDCPCCHRCEMSAIFLDLLDMLREACHRPLLITSGYRCHSHNLKVGGVPRSQHLKGLAVDIAVRSEKEAEELIGKAKALGFRGIGKGKTFVHVDLREGDPAEWTYP